MSSSPSVADAPIATQQRAIAVLLSDVEEAQRVAAALDEVRRPEGPLVVIAVPPVRGLSFFAAADRQEKLDRWWAHAIPATSVPIYLLRHEDGVARWLPGLDGHFFIAGVPGEHAEQYHGMINATVVAGTATLDLALALTEGMASARLFREDARARLQHRLGRRPNAAAAGRFRRARLRPADEVFVSGTPVPPGTHPIPNLPDAPPEVVSRAASAGASAPDLVRALADTLHRLQKIRSSR